MADLRVDAVLDEGLGNQAYLVDLGDGRGLALDPTLDLRSLDALAASRGLTVEYAAETHLHADFLSGAVRLSRRDGARAIGSTAGARRFDHVGLVDGDDVDLGGLTLRGWATPGHTDEHMSYLLLDGGRPLAVFTGGSLIVGAAARTDLMGAQLAEPLARAQFRSLRRLAELPDDTPVYPTHGAGSFCSAPPGADRTSTIGREKATNPLMRLKDEDAFVDALLGSLGTYPPYFARLAELNRAGVEDPGPAVLAPLSVADVQVLRREGADVVDVRPTEDYVAGHLRGSVAIPLRGVFATWLGWLLPDPRIPVIVVRNPDQDPDEIVWQARKVGYRVAGELVGGVAAWAADGGSVLTTRLVDPVDVDPASVVDVRQRSEYATGHLPGASNVELGALTLPSDVTLPDGPLVAMCGHGERAASGASMLERAGRTDVAVLTGGPGDWAVATGRATEASA
jgi:glyoxylase-like metal-dependent hydrolase (beta-lactamase superfamily II)/rhodanese-related sulfurtransferase